MLKPERTIHIDIPVKLAEVKAVFNIASLSFEGDLAASLFHMGLIVGDVADWKAKSEVVAVFHTNAGHVTLHRSDVLLSTVCLSRHPLVDEARHSQILALLST